MQYYLSEQVFIMARACFYNLESMFGWFFLGILLRPLR